MASPSTTPDRSNSAATSTTASPWAATTPISSPTGDVHARIDDLDNQMDTIFGDAFRNAHDWQNHSAMASSINLREQKDKYIARVYLPHFDTSKAQVKVEHGNLHIVVSPENTGNSNTAGQKYEQTISLPEPVQSDNVEVRRKPDVLVITVPKQTGRETGVASSIATPPQQTASESPANEYGWEKSMADEFARMNEAMDRAFNAVFPDNLGSAPMPLSSIQR